MEDVARFALDDAGLCARLKAARHALTAAIAGLGPVVDLLAASRDTPGDTGTGLTGAGESSRDGLLGIVSAAAGRAQEGVRTIEEMAKALDLARALARAGGEPPAGALERLRYELYDIDRELRLALPGLAPQWRLCVLVSIGLCARPWREVIAEAIAGGADCVQVREKSMPDRELLDHARAVVELVDELAGDISDGRAAVIVNDRPDIALASGATGVHLGQDDMPVRTAREIMGAGAIVGVSTTDLDQARRAVREGASVCGIGPMFASTTKAKSAIAGRGAGPNAVRAYLDDPETAAVPHLAIGGITPGNAGEVAAAGARGIAVSAAVCGADDPRGVCARLVEAMNTRYRAERDR